MNFFLPCGSGEHHTTLQITDSQRSVIDQRITEENFQIARRTSQSQFLPFLLHSEMVVALI